MNAKGKGGNKVRPKKRARRPAPIRRSFPTWHWLGVGACALGIWATQPRLSKDYTDLGVAAEIYAMPSEEQLVVFSLGYRAAAADLLFGRTLVAAGIHFEERRIFHQLDAYLKGILALDPAYYDVYRYADTLLNLSTVEMPKENLWIAREIQERGLRQFPSDPQLWLSTGYFVGYSAPNRMSAPEEQKEKAEWRAAGAKILEHACSIWDDLENLPDVCISTASVLSETGEREAAINALERLIAVSDDERIRQEALVRLRALTDERTASKRRKTLELLEELRGEDLPMVDRLRYQLLAPPNDVRECIGRREIASDVECATSFETRGELMRQVPGKE